MIVEPTDAILRLSASCVCGSDLWPYRGIDAVVQPTPMGHEYCGIVEEVGRDVKNIKPGQFVVGSFFASDNTCPICQAGYQTSCINRQPGAATGAQSPFLRVPLADGTLVATPEVPGKDLIPSLLATSDVLGTGWFAADAAAVCPGKTVVVVGDGAVGLLGVLSAKQMGAERIIVMSRHEARQKLALEFGATDIVTERGDEGVAKIKEMTGGLRCTLCNRGGRNPRINDASYSLYSPWWTRRLRRGYSRCGIAWYGVVLFWCTSSRWPSSRAPLLASSD